MSYWPARVRENCKTDKSLAIAHDLEALYVEPEANRERNLRESGGKTHRPGRDARDVIAAFNGETGKKNPNR